MFNIIISGHGEFATAIEKTLEYIIGEQEQINYINFNNQMSTKDLKMKFLEKLIPTEETLFLTDLVGGSPFSTAVEIKTELINSRIEVIGGTSLPTVLSSLEWREEGDLGENLNQIINYGKESLLLFEKDRERNLADNEDEELDGI